MITKQQLRDYAKAHNVPISFEETIDFLVETITKVDAQNVLEIGTAIGYGSINMATRTNLNHIDTLEIDEATANLARQNIKEFNLEDKVEVHNIDAMKYIETCTKTYDLIYLDGPKGQYVKYLPMLKKLLKKGGVIVADNVFFHGMVLGTTQVTKNCRSMINGLHNFINEFTTDKDLSSQLFNIGDGVAVIVKK